MSSINSISWFRKYQPKTLDEYVFESNQQKEDIKSWIEGGAIPGNLLMYGNAGTGKTALAELIIRSIIKSQYDVQKIKDKGVATFDELHNWCQKQPISSKQKIVYIEEIDRASSAAFNALKDGLMEKYQPHVQFIATTNFINRIEAPVQSRFNIKLNLTCSNVSGIWDRLTSILEAEQVTFDGMKMKTFIEMNHSIGLRNMINLLQVSVHNGIVDFDNMKLAKSEQEENVVNLVGQLFNELNKLQVSQKIVAVKQPLDTPIAPIYSSILETINYNSDINYVTIFTELLNKTKFLPLKVIIDEFLQDVETKRYLNIHFIAFLYKAMKCYVELSI